MNWSFIDYYDHIPFSFVKYKDGCLKVETDSRTKYHLEKIHKQSAIVKKKLNKKLKNVWFGRDNENEYIILIGIKGNTYRVEAKQDRAFFFTYSDKDRSIVFRELCNKFGEENISIQGENKLIQLIL